MSNVMPLPELCNYSTSIFNIGMPFFEFVAAFGIAKMLPFGDVITAFIAIINHKKTHITSH